VDGESTKPWLPQTRPPKSSAAGGPLFRVHRSAPQVDRWRVAADADKDAWPTTFRAFVEDRLAVLDACRANVNATLQGGEPPQSST